MKRLVSGIALALTSLGLAACGASNDPATNATLGNDATLHEELPADENVGAAGNELIDDSAAENALVSNEQ